VLKREFKGGLNQSEYRTSPTLRHAENLSKEYRTVELLHKRGMAFYGTMVLPTQTILGQFILYCNFTLIRHWTKLDATMKCFISLVTFSVLCFWGSTLEASGRFHMDSTKALKSWKLLNFRNKDEAKYLSKFRKSCRPLTVGTGEVFKIKRLNVLKFFRGIVKGTFRALLTL
jgi:hypothetical protein